MRHRRIGIVFLLVGAFLFGLFLWQEKDRLLMMFVQRLLDRIEKLVAVEISVEQVAFRFPLSLEIRGFSVQGKDFSFLASQGRIRWNPISLLHGRASQEKIFLELDDGELVTKPGNPLDWLASFAFSHWPPFEVTVRKLRWKGNVPLEPLQIHLENLQDRLVMEIRNEALEIKGTLWEKRELAWEARISAEKSCWKGRLDLKTSL
ncbi:MAG: hypothetical protein N2Z84_02330, partial [Atribacterota bacterium]|nr:hypothetical protein [Atribacterota bacterium]